MQIFKEKLAKKTETVLRERLNHAFEFPISDAEYAAMAAALKNTNARYEVAKIISYMTVCYFVASSNRTHIHTDTCLT